MPDSQIKYTDVFAPDYQAGIDRANALLQQQIKYLEKLKMSFSSAKPESMAQHNEELKDAVELTEEMTRVKQVEGKYQQALNKAMADGTAQLELEKQAKAQATQAGRNWAKQQLASSGSMEQLSLRLGEARMRYRQLDQAQRNNKKVGGVLLKQIKQMDKEIKRLDASIGNHQRNVGNYTQSIQQAAGSLANFGPAGNAAVSVVKSMIVSMKGLRLAIMGTGIGALVIAVASLVTYFQSTHQGAMRLQKILAPFKVTFMVLKDLLADVGEYLYNAFSNPKQLIIDFARALKDNVMERVASVIDMFGYLGDAIKYTFSGEWDKAGEAVKSAGKEMVDVLTGVAGTTDRASEAMEWYNEKMQEYSETVRNKTNQEIALIERQFALEREMLKWTVDRAAIESEIANARLNAQQLQNTDAQKALEYQTRAIELTKQMYATERQLLAEQVAIAGERLNMFDSTLQDEQEYANLQAELIKLDTQQANGLRELTERFNTLARAIRASNAELSKMPQLYDQTSSMASEMSVEMDEEAEKRAQQVERDRVNHQIRIEQEQELERVRLDVASASISAIGDVAEAMGASAEAIKAIRIAETIIDTYKSATAAYAALVGLGPAGPVLAAIAAAASVAAGLANVARIKNTQIPSYAKGTEYLNGDAQGPTGGIFVEAHQGERIVPSEINRLLMGIPNEALPGLISIKSSTEQAELKQIAKMQLSHIINTNRLLRGGLRWTDHDGSIVDADGNRKKYVN